MGLAVYVLIQLLRFELPVALVEADLLLFNQRVFTQAMFEVTCTFILILSVIGHAALREHEARRREKQAEQKRHAANKRRQAAAKQRRAEEQHTH